MMFDFFFFLKPPTNKSQDLLVVITKYLDKNIYAVVNNINTRVICANVFYLLLLNVHPL